MHRHVDDDIPNAYPLTLTGLGVNEAVSSEKFPTYAEVRATALSKPNGALSLYKRIEDLFSFGAISDSERNNLNKLVSINPVAAQKSIQPLEDRFFAKGAPTAKAMIGSSWIDGNLPEGYKLNQKLVPNLPNYMLYAVGGIFAIFTLKSLTRK